MSLPTKDDALRWRIGDDSGIDQILSFYALVGDEPLYRVCRNCEGQGTYRYRQGGPHGVAQGRAKCGACHETGFVQVWPPKGASR